MKKPPPLVLARAQRAVASTESEKHVYVALGDYRKLTAVAREAVQISRTRIFSETFRAAIKDLEA